MVTNGGAFLKIPDITQCSICLETFTEPKVLPCIHTFCLQCLDKHCESRSQDKEVACPLCRTIFSIPSGGIQDLPFNVFIQQLLNVGKSTGAHDFDRLCVCELCSDSEAGVKATSFCIECDQNICDRCSGIHKKTKSTKFHQIVQSESMPSFAERLKFKESYCDQHPSEQNRLYCYDCKMIMCHKCVSQHNQHKLSDVCESGDKFCNQLKDDITTVSAYAYEKQMQIIQHENNKRSFMKKVASTESEISQKCDQLISLIQSHKSLLMEELNQFKEKVAKQLDIQKDEIERQFVIAESFKRYCQEMMDKGTACEISRSAHDLHARAGELVKVQDEPVCFVLSEVAVALLPTFSSTNCVKNFIGELVLNDGAVFAIENDRRDQRLRLTKFLDKPIIRHVMRSTGQKINGLTAVGSAIFVVRSMPEVEVYKTNDLSFVRKLNVTGSKELRGLVSCKHYNCLYAADPVQQVIYRYDLISDVASKWSVSGACRRLSVTKCHSVIVTLYNIKRIQEYTTHGSLLKDISLDSRIDIPWHCVQLSSGNYAVCHAGTSIVNPRGRIIQSYGGSSGSGFPNICGPYHLAVDTHDNVLIADCDNNRVQLLSPTLTYLGDIVIPRHQLDGPYTLHIDELNQHLYIAERQGGRIFVLNVIV